MKKRIGVFSVLWLLVFVFCSFAVPAGPDKKTAKKAEKLMVKALEAINLEQPDQAIDLLKQVLLLTPDHAVVHHNLGVLYFEKGMADEAIAKFEEALRLQPEYQQAQLALRQALFEAGKNESSKKDFEKSNGYLLKLRDLPYVFVGKENDDVLSKTRYLLGFNFFNLKQYPQSQANFELCKTMAGLEMENLDLYANATYFLGLIDSIKKQYDDSNYYFKKYLTLYVALEKKPDLYAQANYFIGANLYQQLMDKMAKSDVTRMAEDAAEIIPYLEQAITDKTSSEYAHVMLGNCHVYRNEIDLAIKDYQQLIEAFPQSQQLQNYKTYLVELQKMPLEKKAKKKH